MLNMFNKKSEKQNWLFFEPCRQAEIVHNTVDHKNDHNQNENNT